MDSLPREGGPSPHPLSSALEHHHSSVPPLCTFRHYQEILMQFGVMQSVCHPAYGCDKTPQISFTGILKSELSHHLPCRTGKEPIRRVMGHL